jgi:hypothetical protein
LLAAAESRKAIIFREDTPSASGTLLGSEVLTCFFVHEMRVRQRIITAKDDLFKKIFIGVRFNELSKTEIILHKNVIYC